MTATRGRILEYLKVRGKATANEIGYALGLTPADVRHHLSILRSQGTIEIIGKRPGHGRGRPAYLYSSTSQAQRNNLGDLASALLDELLCQSNKGEPAKVYQQISERLLGQVDGRGNLSQRLYRAVEKLNELNYQAHWEARSPTPQLILGHCPYAAIIENHPEICKIDAAMLETLVDVPVRQTGKLDVDERGGKYCLFEILGS